MTKISLTAAVLAVLLASTTAVAQEAQTQTASGQRFGLGLGVSNGGLGVFNGRLDLDGTNLIDANLGFRLKSGDFGDGTDVALGGAFLHRIFKNDPVMFHAGGGLMLVRGSDERETTITAGTPPVTVKSTQTTTDMDIVLMGLIGAEYFFPGTKQFSLEIDMGPAIHIVSQDVDNEVSGKTTSASADGVTIDLGAQAGIKFVYYFPQ